MRLHYSATMRTFTDKEILDRLTTLKSWQGVPNGVLDVWVRSKADAYNRFDDKVFTYEFAADPTVKPKFIMACTGTTNAGAEGLKHFDKYNRLGCAVLKADEIVYGSHAYGLHKGQYPAYRQVKPFPYFRDNDKDEKAEELGKVYYDIIGANCHRAGWNSVYIGGWSVACLVRNQRTQYDKWMQYMNKRPLTVAILAEW